MRSFVWLTFSILLFAPFALRGAEAILPPETNLGPVNSALVSTPHVAAELIAEEASVSPGQSFGVILHLHIDPAWHTYWINPGDAGIPTKIDWTLPPGFTAGPIQWPVPEINQISGLTTYGYGGDVYLLTTITASKDVKDLPADGKVELKAKARWLVCQDVCIPGSAELSVKVIYPNGPIRLIEDATAHEARKKLFAKARARLSVSGYAVRQASFDAQNLNLKFGMGRVAGYLPPFIQVRFLPEQPNVLAANQPLQAWTGGFPNQLDKTLSFPLGQNGEKPDHLSGLLMTYDASGTFVLAYQITSFPVTNSPPAATSSPHSQVGAPARGDISLLFALGAAFVGGLILNLMPCVLPVLSLKVFSLVRHAQEKKGVAWAQGLAFTAGVVVSFWALAGLLLGLRAAGEQLGWGFQMQSPGFVLFLTLLFFIMALNLLGVFEIGTSLVGLDAKVGAATKRQFPPALTSFLYGALAVIATTPCTAPFMGSALGFAAQQSAWVALLVFTALALGMAAPYLVLTAFPGALRFIPKPGAWMEAFKQLMGFLLLGTVIFLVYVFEALTAPLLDIALLTLLLLTALVTWIYGRWGLAKWTSRALFSIFVLIWIFSIYRLLDVVASVHDLKASDHDDGYSQPYSPAAVAAALDAGHPVFVDFTAAWCLSCKVNEHVALEADSVQKAFAEKSVVLLQGDDTHFDAAITATLRQYNRDGVPLYLYFTPATRDHPQVLPEVLTPGIVLDALNHPQNP